MHIHSYLHLINTETCIPKICLFLSVQVLPCRDHQIFNLWTVGRIRICLSCTLHPAADQQHVHSASAVLLPILSYYSGWKIEQIGCCMQDELLAGHTAQQCSLLQLLFLIQMQMCKDGSHLLLILAH